VGDNKIIVCGLNSKLISIIDRNQRAVVQEIINPLPMGIEKQRQLIEVVGFDPEMFPFVILRDDAGVKIINVKEGILYDLL
jgi:hypothetical protein